MKLVFESYLLYFLTRSYKVTYNLGQNLLENFRVYVFFTFSRRALPSHTREACVKTQVSVLRPGYIMEGGEICIQFTKPPGGSKTLVTGYWWLVTGIW